LSSPNKVPQLIGGPIWCCELQRRTRAASNERGRQSCALRSDRPKRRTFALRASVSSDRCARRDITVYGSGWVAIAIGPNSTQLADQCSLCPTQLVRQVGPIESSCDGSPTRLTAVISELVDVYAERPRPVAKSGADGGRESARTRPEVIAPRSSAGTSLYPEVQENRGHHDGSTAHRPEAPSDADHRPVGSLISGPLDAAPIERFTRGDDAPTEPAAKVHQPPGDPSRRPHRIEGRSPSPLTRTAIIGIAHVRPVESR
jgi:hypothetical protein